MAFSDRPLQQIEVEDLFALISDGEPEGKTLEYKRSQVGTTDSERKEFLYDVSSFANSLGGHIVFGVEEENGFPIRMDGLAGVIGHDEILRLERMARDGIRPPITGLESVSATLQNGNCVIVMRIPRSWNPPHQVVYQNAFRFYGRNSKGKYHLDVDELRSVFMLSASAAERIRLFRIDRIAKVASQETSIELDSSAKIITHIFPLSAFTTRDIVDLSLAWRDGLLGASSFNVDGLVSSAFLANGSRYKQLFRNGCMETISQFSAQANSGRILPCPAFERMVIDQVREAKSIFQKIGIAPPIVVMLTLMGMKGCKIATDHSGSAGNFDRDPVFIPELILEAFNGRHQDEVKPLLDVVWNAAGSPGSPNYDPEGKRKQDDG